MAITRVQQSQISGSLSFNDKLAAGSALAGKSTLAGDLDSLRSQLNKVIGSDNWYSALSGSQSLATVYGAMHVDGTSAALQGALSVAGVADFASPVYAAAAMGVSGTLAVAGAATMASTLAVTGDMTGSAGLKIVGASDLRGTLAVGGKADFAGIVDVAGTLSASAIKIDGDAPQSLYIVDSDGSIKDEGNLVYDQSNLIVKSSGLKLQDSIGRQSFLVDSSGNMDVKGGSVLSGSLKIANDVANRVYVVGMDGSVTDSMGLTYDGSVLSVNGAVTASSGLRVSGGATSFASAPSIDGDTATRLYIVGGDGSISDERQLTFATGVFSVNTMMGASQFSVTGSSGDVYMAGDLTVAGNDIKSSTAVAMSLSGADVEVKGDLTVTGNDIKSSTAIALTLSGTDVEVLGDLKVSGNDIKASDGNTAITLLGSGDVKIAHDLVIENDLRVKGSMTYIDTSNLRVQDAFIYLATGSAGTTDSGIVLHGGAGAGMDLVIGQDGGAGEVIFGKMDRSPDGGGAMDGIALVAAWSSAIKLGSAEGSLSGSLAAVAGGIELKAAAGKSLSVEAATDLTLKANSFSMGLGSSAEYTTFDGNFSATTIVGALNELYAAGAGGSKKGNFGAADLSGDVLSFSTLGTLSKAEQQYVDVYLNGVLLAYGKDLSSVASTSITLDHAIASALVADDCLTVVLRGAA